MRIAIDAGHGRYTAGKRCLKSIDPAETREWVLNQRIASKVVEHLTRCGFEVFRTDDVTGSTDVTLPNRSSAINKSGANYAISIHHDSGANGGKAGGCTVFVYSGAHSDKSDALQKAVYDGIIAETGKFGNRSTPLNSANFHMVREPKCPSILIECAFMDSVIDTPMLLTESFASKVAVGIAKGICKATGKRFVTENVTVNASQQKTEEIEMTKAEVEALIDKRVSDKLAKLTDITGSGDIPSSWAVEACEWARQQGIFVGDGNDNFGWQQMVTREQLAVILLKIFSKQAKAE